MWLPSHYHCTEYGAGSRLNLLHRREWFASKLEGLSYPRHCLILYHNYFIHLYCFPLQRGPWPTRVPPFCLHRAALHEYPLILLEVTLASICSVWIYCDYGVIEHVLWGSLGGYLSIRLISTIWQLPRQSNAIKFVSDELAYCWRHRVLPDSTSGAIVFST